MAVNDDPKLYVLGWGHEPKFKQSHEKIQSAIAHGQVVEICLLQCFETVARYTVRSSRLIIRNRLSGKYRSDQLLLLQQGPDDLVQSLSSVQEQTGTEPMNGTCSTAIQTHELRMELIAPLPYTIMNTETILETKHLEFHNEQKYNEKDCNGEEKSGTNDSTNDDTCEEEKSGTNDEEKDGSMDDIGHVLPFIPPLSLNLLRSLVTPDLSVTPPNSPPPDRYPHTPTGKAKNVAQGSISGIIPLTPKTPKSPKHPHSPKSPRLKSKDRHAHTSSSPPTERPSFSSPHTPRDKNSHSNPQTPKEKRLSDGSSRNTPRDKHQQTPRSQRFSAHSSDGLLNQSERPRPNPQSNEPTKGKPKLGNVSGSESPKSAGRKKSEPLEMSASHAREKIRHSADPSPLPRKPRTPDPQSRVRAQSSTQYISGSSSMPNVAAVFGKFSSEPVTPRMSALLASVSATTTIITTTPPQTPRTESNPHTPRHSHSRGTSSPLAPHNGGSKRISGGLHSSPTLTPSLSAVSSPTTTTTIVPALELGPTLELGPKKPRVVYSMSEKSNLAHKDVDDEDEDPGKDKMSSRFRSKSNPTKRKYGATIKRDAILEEENETRSPREATKNTEKLESHFPRFGSNNESHSISQTNSSSNERHSTSQNNSSHNSNNGSNNGSNNSSLHNSSRNNFEKGEGRREKENFEDNFPRNCAEIRLKRKRGDSHGTEDYFRRMGPKGQARRDSEGHHSDEETGLRSRPRSSEYDGHLAPFGGSRENEKRGDSGGRSFDDDRLRPFTYQEGKRREDSGGRHSDVSDDNSSDNEGTLAPFCLHVKHSCYTIKTKRRREDDSFQIIAFPLYTGFQAKIRHVTEPEMSIDIEQFSSHKRRAARRRSTPNDFISSRAGVPMAQSDGMESLSRGHGRSPSVPIKTVKRVDVELKEVLDDLKALLRQMPGYWIEASNKTYSFADYSDEIKIQIEDAGDNYPWYQSNFAPFHHVNFVGRDKKIGPLVLSIIVESMPSGCYLLVLMRTTKMDFRESILVESAKDGRRPLFKKSSRLPSASAILQAITSHHNIFLEPKMLKKAKDQEKIVNSLLQYETMRLRTKFTFGVLYCKEGQVNEIEMFGNGDEKVHITCDVFSQVLFFRGRRIRLAGWKDFSGGLDTSGRDMTGSQTVYSKWRGMEFIFHVSTFLPFSLTDPQNPYVTCSDVLVVVQPLDGPDNTLYRISVSSKDGVPGFGPELPRSSIFRADEFFRDFLFCKMVNGERAAFKASTFSALEMRSRAQSLESIVDEFSDEK